MSYLIIADFSKTLTRANSKTSWSLFAESKILWEEYAQGRDALYEEYRKYEEVGNAEKTSEWFRRHCELLNKFNAIDHLPRMISIVQEQRLLLPRDGFLEFFEWCGKISRVSALEIVSSGITELIEEFLLQQKVTKPLFRVIWANQLKKSSPIITPLNKQNFLFNKYQAKNEEIVIILWDSILDFPRFSDHWTSRDYTSDGSYRGFSFTDTEIVDGVVPLGREGSLLAVIDSLI